MFYPRQAARPLSRYLWHGRRTCIVLEISPPQVLQINTVPGMIHILEVNFELGVDNGLDNGILGN
jgi:hypothetical protein